MTNSNDRQRIIFISNVKETYNNGTIDLLQLSKQYPNVVFFTSDHDDRYKPKPTDPTINRNNIIKGGEKYIKVHGIDELRKSVKIGESILTLVFDYDTGLIGLSIDASIHKVIMLGVVPYNNVNNEEKLLPYNQDSNSVYTYHDDFSRFTISSNVNKCRVFIAVQPLEPIAAGTTLNANIILKYGGNIIDSNTDIMITPTIYNNVDDIINNLNITNTNINIQDILKFSESQLTSLLLNSQDQGTSRVDNEIKGDNERYPDYVILGYDIDYNKFVTLNDNNPISLQFDAINLKNLEYYFYNLDYQLTNGKLDVTDNYKISNQIVELNNIEVTPFINKYQIDSEDDVIEFRYTDNEFIDDSTKWDDDDIELTCKVSGYIHNTLLKSDNFADIIDNYHYNDNPHELGDFEFVPQLWFGQNHDKGPLSISIINQINNEINSNPTQILPDYDDLIISYNSTYQKHYNFIEVSDIALTNGNEYIYTITLKHLFKDALKWYINNNANLDYTVTDEDLDYIWAGIEVTKVGYHPISTRVNLSDEPNNYILNNYSQLISYNYHNFVFGGYRYKWGIYVGDYYENTTMESDIIQDFRTNNQSPNQMFALSIQDITKKNEHGYEDGRIYQLNDYIFNNSQVSMKYTYLVLPFEFYNKDNSQLGKILISNGISYSVMDNDIQKDAYFCTIPQQIGNLFEYTYGDRAITYIILMISSPITGSILLLNNNDNSKIYANI